MRIPRHFRDFVPFVRIEYHFCLTSRANIRNCTCEKWFRSCDRYDPYIPLSPGIIKAKISGGGKIHETRTYTFARHFEILSLRTTLLYRVFSRLASKTWVSRNSLAELSSSAPHSTTRAHTEQLGNPTAGQLLENCSFGFILFYRANFLPSPLSSFPFDFPCPSFPFEISLPLFRAYEVQYTFIGLVPAGYKPLPCAPSLHRAPSIEVFR